MRRPSRSFCLMLGLLVVSSQIPVSALAHMPPAASHPALTGGLTLRSRAPLYDNRLSYPTGRSALLVPKQWEAAVALSHVNTWAQMPNYFFDGEFSRLEMRLALGTAFHAEVAVHLSALRRSGGSFDGFIEGFHHLLSITQSRRDQYRRDRLRVSTGRGPQEVVHLTDADTGAALLAPTLVARKGFWRGGTRPVFTTELHIQLPLWREAVPYRAPGPSFLLALSTDQALWRWLDVMAAGGVIIAPAPGRLYGMPLASISKFLMLGAAFRLHRDLRLVVHYLNQDGMAESPQFWPMHLSTNEFALGLKWAPRAARRWAWELGIIENSVHDANTPDFGVSLAMSVYAG